MTVYWNRGKQSITLGVYGFGFQILPFLKIFITDFSESKKAIKLKVRINRDNDWMYLLCWNRGKGSITHGVISLGSFSFSNFAILENFCNSFLRT